MTTPATLTTPASRLFSFLAAVNRIRDYHDDTATRDAARQCARLACELHERGGSPRQAVEAAARLLFSIDQPPNAPTIDQPGGLCHWLRCAWMELARAAASLVGCDDCDGEFDPPRFRSLTNQGLAAEIEAILWPDYAR